jgi:NAD(P)-dependent dehydrogenase (short-subunit alcohol dehydrogenase family)
MVLTKREDDDMAQTIENQVILVTGATDGLGKQVSLDLAARGAKILLHGRNQKKGESTVHQIRNATGNDKLIYYNADFSSLDAVRRLAKEIQGDQERLDVLINNAAIGVGLRQAGREMSADGYELRFAVNYLAHFLLTHQLLPLLRLSIPSRIVNVASVGQQAIDFNNVMLEHEYDGLRAYRQSKLAQVMFTFDLAEELSEGGVTVNSLHPATLMNTKMMFETDYFRGPMSTVEEGAHAVEYLAVSPEVGSVAGAYFEGNQEARANSQAYDREARRQLRMLSETLTGLKEPTD